MADEKDRKKASNNVLTAEQDDLLDLYIQNLDGYYEELRASDAIQVEIETQHLKKILST
ncbi:hypothetical protein [Pontibacter diazotrophicus]|uniref:hypothetical protein n=1 Tax=Pontibacter diazotrophicus TaxID=1400979 RepID=UPI0015F17E38|nr:hypothetical protein [Pontibacter diazotrophicus]